MDSNTCSVYTVGPVVVSRTSERIIVKVDNRPEYEREFGVLSGPEALQYARRLAAKIEQSH